MALRIGKKKAAATEDFSPESLQAASPPVIDTSAQTVPFGDQVNTAPTGSEPDFGFETTPFDATTTHAETVYTEPVQTQPVYAEEVHPDEVAVVAPAKKRVPLPALIGLGALGLLGLGALAWSKMTPAEETEDAPIVVRHTPLRPAPIKAAPAKVIVVKGAPAKPATRLATKPVVVKTATTKTVTTQTGATGPGATPGTSAATTTTKTTVATALVPNQQAAAAAIAGGPRVVAPVDQPAPVLFPPPAARPGKWADPNEVTVTKRAQIALVVAPAVKARLKVLWKQGADAKHRKDYAGARRAWNQALKLAPGYPGFADSIAKLPR